MVLTHIHLLNDVFLRGPDNYGVVMRVVAEVCSVIRRVVGSHPMTKELFLDIIPHGIYGSTGDPLQGCLKITLSDGHNIITTTDAKFRIYVGEAGVLFLDSEEKPSGIGNIIQKIFPPDIFTSQAAHWNFLKSCSWAK